MFCMELGIWRLYSVNAQKSRGGASWDSSAGRAQDPDQLECLNPGQSNGLGILLSAFADSQVLEAKPTDTIPHAEPGNQVSLDYECR